MHSLLKQINYTKIVFCALFSLVFLSFSINEAKAFESDARQAILIDFATGTTLYEKNSKERMGPSSMTKMMTAYLIFEAIKNNDYSLDSSFLVSKKAWKTGGSQMFLEVGKEVTLSDLIQGIIIQSGNDACVVAAEGIAGTTEDFAEKMNEKAKLFGLTNTHFVNPHGLTEQNHYSTAMDLAVIARHLITDFPEDYHYWSQRDFTYNKIHQTNRNLLLNKPSLGVDGLKTGHTDDAGYGITVSAAKNGRRLIVVVNGLPSISKRTEAAEKLVIYGFNNFKNTTLFEKFDTLASVNIWGGVKDKVKIALDESVELVLPKSGSEKANIKTFVTYNQPINAPITKGQKLGELVVYKGDTIIRTSPLLATESVNEAGFSKKIYKKAILFLKNILAKI